MSLTCELRDIRSLDDVYRQLAEQLPLPGHFGDNLDALYDSLVADLSGPLVLIWRDHGASRDLLGERYDDLVAVLEDASAERGDFTIEWL